MEAPEVDLHRELPERVAAVLDEILHEGCRGLLLDPEEEFTRWYVFFDNELRELDRTPIDKHSQYMAGLSACANSAVTVDQERFRIEDFRSFNEFGDRYSLQFFKEGASSFDETFIRRRDNIRLVNRLKPATCTTYKNEMDIVRVLNKNGLGDAYLEHLCRDGLISEERFNGIRREGDYLLSTIQSTIIPRKMAAIALADCLGCEYLDVERVTFDKAITHKVDKAWKSQKQVFPYVIEDDKLMVAMMDPSDSETVEYLETVYGHKTKIFCSAAQDIAVMIRKAHKDDQA